MELAPGDARKLAIVLRKKAGDAVEIVDSSGREFAASLVTCDAGRVAAALERELSAPARPRLRVTLAQGVPKGQKMDYVVEKATELGVERIVPFTSERSVATAAGDAKLERWRRLARTAAQQCGRTDVTEIATPLGFSALLALFAEYDRTLVPWELADRFPLRERLPNLISGVAALCVVIGPEGGLSEEEVTSARTAGAELVSLGSRILRTETAGLVICSVVLYHIGDL